MNDLLQYLTPLKEGSKIKEFLSASRINAIQELLRRLVGGENIANGPGLLVSRAAGSVAIRALPSRGRGTRMLPFDLSQSADGDGNVILQYGVVSGAGFDQAPNYGGSPITAETTIGPVAGCHVALKWTFEPNVIQTGLSTEGDPVYGFGAGGEVVGTPEIWVTSDPSGDATDATVNSSTGAVTANGVHISTLAVYDGSGKMIGPQQRYGPLTLSICGGAGEVGAASYVG